MCVRRTCSTQLEQVLVGKEKKDRIMSKEERRIVSYHEVGHALISALQKNSEPVQKITIVPRTMGALGYVMHVPEEEKYLNTEAELRDMLVSLVGGRAAEEIVFETVTTGAANDIEKATNIAKAMVTEYGMSKKFGLIGLASMQNKYLDSAATLNCSDATEAEIDAEVVAILKESYEKAKEMLGENRELMDKLAEYLIERETITGKEFMEIFRREKGLPEPEEEPKAESQSSKTMVGQSQVDVTITDETAHSQDVQGEIGQINQEVESGRTSRETESGQNPWGAETGQTSQGPGASVPEVVLPEAPTIPSGGINQESDAQESSESQTEENGKPSDEERPWPPQQPPKGTTGRFSGGNL